MTSATALFRYRISLAVFIAGLLVSGLTAFPLLREMNLLASWLGLDGASSPVGHSGLSFWILTVKFGLEDMHARYPWIAYGTDWLAFGHIVIAFFFVAPLFRPADSRSVLYAGIAACVSVVPLALIAGEIRGIPLYWRLIDCSFGVFGVVPLVYCLSLLRHIVPHGPTSTP